MRRRLSFPAGPTLRNWFFEIVLLSLVLLIGVAVWQFYSLAWGEGMDGGYTAGRSPNPAVHGTPAARSTPK
jgi:hypothetical protein